MKNVLVLGLCLLSVMSFAQKGEQFPELQGESLEGTQITIPTDTGDKITIVGMAYSKKSEATLKTWYEPMFDKFVLKRGIMDHLYDVNFYFIPMYTGAKKAAYDVSIKKMKESNRKDLFPYLLFYKGSMDPYVDVLKMDKKDLPYLFIIDESGTIIYATKGLYSEKKMEEIEAALDAQLD
ncbi:MAG: hypothetical protein MK081_12265 [Flavobacteriales bacterium]|nr:hypothetical protein [Flavobacteriales bacterium]